jgi:hypothetical protein
MLIRLRRDQTRSATGRPESGADTDPLQAPPPDPPSVTPPSQPANEPVETFAPPSGGNTRARSETNLLLLSVCPPWSMLRCRISNRIRDAPVSARRLAHTASRQRPRCAHAWQRRMVVAPRTAVCGPRPPNRDEGFLSPLLSRHPAGAASSRDVRQERPADARRTPAERRRGSDARLSLIAVPITTAGGSRTCSPSLADAPRTQRKRITQWPTITTIPRDAPDHR